jgi:hypothetical protein
MSRSICALLVLLALAFTGCTSRPRAPTLVNDAVYQNDEAGFRLEIPKNWAVQSKTILMRGEAVPQERKLIGYKLPDIDRPASFEISCMDMPEGADLVSHFTAGRTGPEAWRPSGPIESIALGSVPAHRLILTFGTGAGALRKEVVAVRSGGRVYFFTLVCAPDDVGSRETIRQELSRITWKSH